MCTAQTTLLNSVLRSVSQWSRHYLRPGDHFLTFTAVSLEDARRMKKNGAVFTAGSAARVRISISLNTVFQRWACVPEMLSRLASVRIFQTASRLRAGFSPKNSCILALASSLIGSAFFYRVIFAPLIYFALFSRPRFSRLVILLCREL